jgi:hypothetical protein
VTPCSCASPASSCIIVQSPTLALL